MIVKGGFVHVAFALIKRITIVHGYKYSLAHFSKIYNSKFHKFKKNFLNHIFRPIFLFHTDFSVNSRNFQPGFI